MVTDLDLMGRNFCSIKSHPPRKFFSQNHRYKPFCPMLSISMPIFAEVISLAVCKQGPGKRNMRHRLAGGLSTTLALPSHCCQGKRKYRKKIKRHNSHREPYIVLQVNQVFSIRIWSISVILCNIPLNPASLQYRHCHDS